MPLIEQIIQRLTKELPGEPAQFEMLSLLMQQQRGHFESRPSAKKAAVLILLYKEKQEWYTLLMQRTASPYAHSKEVCLPGGRFEIEDKDLSFTAVRETEEEFGIPKELVNLLGKLTPVYIPVSNHEVHPFVGVLDTKPVLTPALDEVDEIIEIPISLLCDDSVKKRKTLTTSSGYTLEDVPYFDLANKTVWGATAMMLNEFVTVLNEARKEQGQTASNS